MSPTEDLIELTERIADLVEGLRAPYAIGGAIAQNFWGVVRATQDLDLLLSLPRIRFEDLRTGLDSEGFEIVDASGVRHPVTVEAILSQERDRHMVAVHRGLVKVEIFFLFLPLQHSILRRAIRMQLRSRTIPITSAEDLIVLKMAFHREKDLRDVRGILWSQKGKLDLAYIRDWSAQMLAEDVQAELERWIEEYGR
jgi:hypothetical protein